MRDHENGIDRRDKKGRTLLIAAAAEGNIGKVKRLLAEGADPNLTDSQTHITISTEKPGRCTDTEEGHDVSSHSQFGSILLLKCSSGSDTLRIKQYSRGAGCLYCNKRSYHVENPRMHRGARCIAVGDCCGSDLFGQ
jgi:hypothetical protein